MPRILLVIAAIGLLGCGGAPPPDPAPVPEPPPLLPDGTPVGEDAIEPEPEPVPAISAEPQVAEPPAAQPAAESPSEAGLVPGANLTVGSMSVNDMTVNDLECRLDSMGFMAAMQLVASIAAQKKAMDKCAPKGDAPLVRWTFAGGKAKDVAVEGAADDKVRKCVSKSAAKMESAVDGTCAAYFLVGAEAGATAAYDKAKGGK